MVIPIVIMIEEEQLMWLGYVLRKGWIRIARKMFEAMEVERRKERKAMNNMKIRYEKLKAAGRNGANLGNN